MEPVTTSLTVPIMIFCIALLARALFSFLETSITALRLFRLKEIAETIPGYNTFFSTLEKEPQRILITILVANSLADVTTAALAPYIIESLFAHLHIPRSISFSFGIVFTTIALLIFGEIIPKALARARSDRLFRSTLWIVDLLYRIFYPLVSMLLAFSSFFTRRFARTDQEGSPQELAASEKEIRFLIDYIHEKGMMEEEKSEMLQNIFELGITPVKEIMVPAHDVVTIHSTTSLKDTLQVFLKNHFSRLPVYKGEKDNVVGMVHVKDLLAVHTAGTDTTIEQLLRPIMFIPETVKINQLLREFQQKHMHIAMVINEHGIIIGLITLEDVLEEIVGDISDEHELETKHIIPLRKNEWLISASSSLEEVGDLLDIAFESEDAVTLGGFLTEQLQHLPRTGETLQYQNHNFRVKKASNKRVIQVIISKND